MIKIIMQVFSLRFFYVYAKWRKFHWSVCSRNFSSLPGPNRHALPHKMFTFYQSQYWYDSNPYELIFCVLVDKRLYLLETFLGWFLSFDQHLLTLTLCSAFINIFQNYQCLCCSFETKRDKEGPAHLWIQDYDRVLQQAEKFSGSSEIPHSNVL